MKYLRKSGEGNDLFPSLVNLKEPKPQVDQLFYILAMILNHLGFLRNREFLVHQELLSWRCPLLHQVSEKES